MIKLLIPRENKKQFEKIFATLSKFNCELAIFPEGLKFRNHQAYGIIYKTAFLEYPFTFKRKLGIANNNPKGFKKWLTSWRDIVKEIDNQARQATEIPIG